MSDLIPLSLYPSSHCCPSIDWDAAHEDKSEPLMFTEDWDDEDLNDEFVKNLREELKSKAAAPSN